MSAPTELALPKLLVCCLVAKTWVAFPQQFVEEGLLFDNWNVSVNHIDMNPENNHASNLRWFIRSENVSAFAKSNKGQAARKKSGEKSGCSVNVKCINDDNIEFSHDSIRAFVQHWPSLKS